MQEMLSDRKPINSASERVEQVEAITFGVRGSLRQSGVSMDFKEGRIRGGDRTTYM